jgi:hypothetical protein
MRTTHVSKLGSGLRQHCIKATMVTAMLAAAGISGSPARAQTSARTFSSVHLVVDGKCLDLPAFSTVNKTHIEIFDCSSGQNQLWTMWSDGTIHSDLNPSKCIDLPAGNTANGTGIEIYDCNGGGNQIWSYGADNTIRGEGGKCLDLPAFNTTNKTQIQYFDCTGGSNQSFAAVP